MTNQQPSPRSSVGHTGPYASYFGRREDDKWCWVKGNGAGKAALCREWIVGRIAQAFGLLVPRFVQAVEGADEHRPEYLVEFANSKPAGILLV